MKVLVEADLAEVGKSLQFSKLNYIDVLVKYGIDKPDLRSNLSFISLEDFYC